MVTRSLDTAPTVKPSLASHSRALRTSLAQHRHRNAGEFGDARANMQVLASGKLETPFPGPAGRADLIGAPFREEAAERCCRGEDQHG